MSDIWRILWLPKWNFSSFTRSVWCGMGWDDPSLIVSPGYGWIRAYVTGLGPLHSGYARETIYRSRDSPLSLPRTHRFLSFLSSSNITQSSSPLDKPEASPSVRLDLVTWSSVRHVDLSIDAIGCNWHSNRYVMSWSDILDAVKFKPLFLDQNIQDFKMSS